MNLEMFKEPAMFVCTIVIITGLLVAIFRNRRGLLVKAALYAVSTAEEAWGSNTGRIKFAEVYSYLHEAFPIITFFFTEAQLTEIIEDALNDMKNILASKASKEKVEEIATSNNV